MQSDTRTTSVRRKALPIRAKLAACERRLCELLKTNKIEYDHRPALWEREVNAEGTDYIPPQNDPKFLQALSVEEHNVKTNGTKATSYGSDAHERAKIDRLTGKTKNGPKQKLRKRANPWPSKGSRKLASRLFPKKREGRI